MNISIIAGTGNNSVTGMQVNSDGIIPTYCSTGATCAPIGWRFADGYTQVNDCDGKYKVSPDMTVYRFPPPICPTTPGLSTVSSTA